LSLRVTVDASVALSWVLPGEANELTNQLRERTLAKPDLVLLVPPIFWFEVSNALWAAVRRGYMGRQAAASRLDALLDFRFETWHTNPPDCLALALDLGIAVYDAVYLRVAQESTTVLWTADHQLRVAAAQAGVPIEPHLTAG
jgi:predicted nucleic acid-binding protein